MSPLLNSSTSGFRIGRGLRGHLVQESSLQAVPWNHLGQFKTWDAQFPLPEILIKLVWGPAGTSRLLKAPKWF